MSQTTITRRRVAQAAGRFFPADPTALEEFIDDLLRQAPEPAEDGGEVRAVVVPHGCYRYSGVTAAHAYRAVAALRGSIRTVAVVGPSHRFALRGMALAGALDFSTPLGDLRVAPGITDRIPGLPGAHVDDLAHATEHSVEVQLPFIQRALGAVDLIPVVTGATTEAQTHALLSTLAADPGTLIVVSSDVSHRCSCAEADAISKDTVHRLTTLRGHIPRSSACGASVLNGLVSTARAMGWAPHLLASSTSGDVTGSRTEVVGYAALSFTAPAGPVPATPHRASP